MLLFLFSKAASQIDVKWPSGFFYRIPTENKLYIIFGWVWKISKGVQISGSISRWTSRRAEIMSSVYHFAKLVSNSKNVKFVISHFKPMSSCQFAILSYHQIIQSKFQVHAQSFQENWDFLSKSQRLKCKM